jgi:hypothetical protein
MQKLTKFQKNPRKTKLENQSPDILKRENNAKKEEKNFKATCLSN